MARFKLVSLAVLALAASACGGTSSDPSTAGVPQDPGVVTAPSTVDVETGATVRFTAQVDGTPTASVRWSVDEPEGGTVDANGVYTAPDLEGTFHVRAQPTAPSAPTAVRSTAAKTTGTSSTVKVHRRNSAVGVSVSPGTVTLPVLGTQTFAATVTGTTNLSVTWSVKEGSACGSVTSAGVYTAPNAAASCTVVATSAADTTRSASAAVTVSAPQVINVAVSPTSPSVLTGGTVTFTASVTGTVSGQSTAVTWSVPPGSGTINPTTGVYVAPATAGTYVVTATSVADATRKGTATVTVSAPAPAVAISITPATVTLDACKGQVFTATVTNTSNTAVTWSVVETGGGTVSNGAYVAPTTAGTYHVLAVSQADPTRSVQATVTVNPEKVLSVAVTPGSATVQANGQLAFAASVTTTCGTFPAQ